MLSCSNWTNHLLELVIHLVMTPKWPGVFTRPSLRPGVKIQGPGVQLSSYEVCMVYTSNPTNQMKQWDVVLTKEFLKRFHSSPRHNFLSNSIFTRISLSNHSLSFWQEQALASSKEVLQDLGICFPSSRFKHWTYNFSSSNLSFF